MAGMHDQFSQVATTTLDNYVGYNKVQDQVFQEDPFWSFLLSKGAKDTEDGGEYIKVPLIHTANSTAGSYGSFDTLDITPQTGIASALFSWKNNSVSIVIDGPTIRKNSGKSAFIKLLDTKIMQAQESLREYLTKTAYGAGTGNNSKDILGLQALVSASGTLAGIDRSSYAWWQAMADSTSESMATDWMRTMVNNVRGSGSRPRPGSDKVGTVDFILMPQDLYESFEGLVEPHLRIQGTGYGKLGFDSLQFKGAEVTWSDFVPANTVYFLSTKYLKLIVHKDADMKTKPFAEPVNQDAIIGHILWMGQLITNNPRRMGVGTNKTA